MASKPICSLLQINRVFQIWEGPPPAGFVDAIDTLHTEGLSDLADQIELIFGTNAAAASITKMQQAWDTRG